MRRSFTFVTEREVANSKQGAYYFFFFERQQNVIKASNLGPYKVRGSEACEACEAHKK